MNFSIKKNIDEKNYFFHFLFLIVYIVKLNQKKIADFQNLMAIEFC